MHCSSKSLPSLFHHLFFPSLVNYSCKHTFYKISLLKKKMPYHLMYSCSYCPIFLPFSGSKTSWNTWAHCLDFVSSHSLETFSSSTETVLVHVTNDLHIAKAKVNSQPSSYLWTEFDTVNHFLLFKHIFHLVSRRTPASPTLLFLSHYDY